MTYAGVLSQVLRNRVLHLWSESLRQSGLPAPGPTYSLQNALGDVAPTTRHFRCLVLTKSHSQARKILSWHAKGLVVDENATDSAVIVHHAPHVPLLLGMPFFFNACVIFLTTTTQIHNERRDVGWRTCSRPVHGFGTETSRHSKRCRMHCLQAKS